MLSYLKIWILSSLPNESIKASRLKVHSVGHQVVDKPKIEILPLKCENWNSLRKKQILYKWKSDNQKYKKNI